MSRLEYKRRLLGGIQEALIAGDVPTRLANNLSYQGLHIATNKSTTNNAKIAIAMKNKILAIRAEVADTPEKPKKPATNDITKNIRAHFSIIRLLYQS